jgi:hypothetical protein
LQKGQRLRALEQAPPSSSNGPQLQALERADVLAPPSSKLGKPFIVESGENRRRLS